jgi:hypothetical protein
VKGSAVTCRFFLHIIASGRSFDEMTRAERTALVAHAMACPDCLGRAVAVFAGELLQDPVGALADVADGARWSRADRAAADPEC